MDRPSKEQKLYLDLDNSNRCISNLPDKLLLRILPLLQMEDLVRTGCLSSRWKNLWKSVPKLDFTQTNIHKTPELIAVVDKALSYHDGLHVKEFRVQAESDLCPIERVESWIDFLVRHNIEVLSLDLTPHKLAYDGISVKKPLTPACLFESNSLTTLSLTFCKINLPPKFCLPSLKILHIGLVLFHHEELATLLVNCPVLKDLTLKNCNWLTDLKIVLENSNLENLNIDEDFIQGYGATEFEICAPKLVSLNFFGIPKRSKYIGKNLRSLASVNFNFMYPPDFTDFWKIQNRKFYGSFIEDFRHTPAIKLSSWCTMNLSFREILGVSPSLSHVVTSMIFETEIWKCYLSGLIYVLKNFPNLNVLDVVVVQNHDNETRDFWKEEMHGVTEYWKPDVCLHHNIRTVRIHGFLASSGLSTMAKSKATEDILNAPSTELELVNFLLKSLTKLETMMIITTKELNNFPASKKLGILCQLSSRLLAFPRSSPKAQVSINPVGRAC